MENLPAKIDYNSQKMLETLKNTVAKDATAEELTMFIEHCKGTGLNPFKREIWFIKTKVGVQIMTGINGFYAIANSHPQYDGCETEVIEEGNRIIKAVCKVFRKDRSRPTIAEAYWDEYAKNFGNWNVMRRVMISKCAEAMAHRKAFPQEMNNLYIPEEFEQERPEFDREAILNPDVAPVDHVIQAGRQKGHTWGAVAKAIGYEKLVELSKNDRARDKLSERDLEQLEALLVELPPGLFELSEEEKNTIVAQESSVN